ncbi:2653_t:CDS:2, partial [Gigaspora margarita]
EFDIPTRFDELGKIATIARTLMTKRALEPSNANNMTPKTKRTKRALEPSNVNNTQ